MDSLQARVDSLEVLQEAMEVVLMGCEGVNDRLPPEDPFRKLCTRMSIDRALLIMDLLDLHYAIRDSLTVQYADSLGYAFSETDTLH